MTTSGEGRTRPGRDAAPGGWLGVAQTVRFRLTVLYSVLLFALAAVALGGIYLALAGSMEARPITRTYDAEQVIRGPGGTIVPIGTVEVATVRDVEQAVNYETLRTLRIYTLGTLGGLFAGSLAIGWVLSGRALRPVRDITRTAEEIQATDLSRRIRLRGPDDELRHLADTIDSMLDRLDSAFQAQRQLIDDASHEMRNPLAVIRANLEIATSTPDAGPDVGADERRRAALVVDRAAARMTNLVEDLLATARRAAPAYADSDIDVADVAREAGEEFAPLAAARNLTVDYRLGTDLAMVGDHDGLRRAVGNLLSNAVRLAPEGSRITVGAGRRPGEGREGELLWITVRDEGPGIADADQPYVFDRFWRGGSGGGRGGGDRRTGLGLAIVRQIVEGHGGRVRLLSRPGAGSTFVLWLPPGRTPVSGVPDADPLAAPRRR